MGLREHTYHTNDINLMISSISVIISLGFFLLKKNIRNIHMKKSSPMKRIMESLKFMSLKRHRRAMMQRVISFGAYFFSMYLCIRLKFWQRRLTKSLSRCHKDMKMYPHIQTSSHFLSMRSNLITQYHNYHRTKKNNGNDIPTK